MNPVTEKFATLFMTQVVPKNFQFKLLQSGSNTCFDYESIDKFMHLRKAEFQKFN